LDIEQIKRAITDQTAAVIVEPIQGEGGVRPIPTETAQALADICSTTQTLLIADEVQCGLGRTGQPFYSSMLGLTPDLMALGKALGAGIPIGAALLSEKVSSSVSYGDHGSTYGGNPLACQAALVFLSALEDGLIQRVSDAGERLRSGLGKLVSASDELHEVRGAGLMCGIEVDIAVADQIVNTALEHKLLINRTAGTVVRLLPPLTISNEDIDDGLIRLRAAFSDAGAQFH
jgi:acetylornithine/succinyldiaminopimelate/putrescine aminotransferase